ncbi:MAG: glycoside hydrolase family 2 TIM barrel-domain containing protein [Verrucomicrobiales bacterium]
MSSAAHGKDSTPRTRSCFDHDWTFIQEDIEDGQNPKIDASSWRKLDLPHDWSIEGEYDKSHPSGASGGYLPTGIGWYRKSFELPTDAQSKRVFIEFDGIYMNSDVWINGQHLGKRAYGYLGFQYDLTPHLNFDGENVIAVRVDNSLQPSSRWYSGSGIYRHVWLTVTDPIHVDHWGTKVWTKTQGNDAEVSIRTTFSAPATENAKIVVKQSILDDQGAVVATANQEVDAQESQQLVQTLVLPKPALWSPDAPNLYTMRTELVAGAQTVDRYDTTFGVRTLEVDSNKGMFLNGESIIMRGVCNHHDLGTLGAALWDDALERRLQMLKDMGCNAIRTAHNPSCPELLELCDEMGFLVVNETFDEWRRGWSFEDGTLVSSKGTKGKARFGYNKYFDDWAERDLTDHILRDQNHPSVIMWSVGNEVPEAQKHGELETVKWLQDLCHKLDPTRPVTVGCNFIKGANESGFAEILDIVGYNGGGGSCFEYENDHKTYPDRLMYASEVPHSLHTRGEYRTHTKYREQQYEVPDLTPEEVFPETHAKYESSYDNAGVRINARDSWRLTRDLPYFMGEFRWTGFDYHGESGGWPRVIGNFGIIDICHFPKDTYYFYQSQWTDKPMAHLFPHWNWAGKEGTEIPVWCYTNGDSAELFLNGKSLGKRTFTEENDMHLEWLVPYEPGELKLIASQDGNVIAEKIVRTASEPKQVALSPDQTQLTAGSRELSYVTVEILDENGNFVPKAGNKVEFEISGPGRLVAVGNGDPLSHQSFQGDEITAFNGLALAIITGTGEPGEIVVTATSEGLSQAKAKVKVVPAAAP